MDNSVARGVWPPLNYALCCIDTTQSASGDLICWIGNIWLMYWSRSRQRCCVTQTASQRHSRTTKCSFVQTNKVKCNLKKSTLSNKKKKLYCMAQKMGEITTELWWGDCNVILMSEALNKSVFVHHFQHFHISLSTQAHIEQSVKVE